MHYLAMMHMRDSWNELDISAKGWKCRYVIVGGDAYKYLHCFVDLRETSRQSYGGMHVVCI